MPIDITINHKEQIDELSAGELRAVATFLKIDFRGNIGRDTLTKRVLAQPPTLIQQALDGMNKEFEKPKAAQVVENTKDQVLTAIKPFTEKEGFEAKFDDEEKTWQFKYRGAMDSGTLMQPLSRIVASAVKVSRGAFRLPTKDDAMGNARSRHYHF